DPIITGAGAVPMHLYEAIPFAQWSTGWPAGLTGSSGGLSTGTVAVHYSTTQYGGSGTTNVYGPTGDGAYMYHGYDPVALVGTDVINPNFYNITGLQSMGWDKIQTVHVDYINDKNAAEAALANGQVNFLDSNYQFNAQDVASLKSQGETVATVNDPSNGWQEMGVNLNNPVFGTGTATPLGQSNPSQAAFAARMVREAISYAIPRSYIVSQLLGGLGAVGITQVATSFTLAYPAGAAPDPYDLTAAKGFLAEAGYNTGVAPPQCTTCTVPTTSIGGVTVPGFILGNSFTQQGQFQVDPVLGAQSGGFAITLQQSTDSGATWTSVALGSTNAGGYFSFNYQPTVTGSVEYRVFFTGLPETVVSTDALGSAGLVESLVPPQATLKPLNVTDIQYSTPVTYNIGSLSDVFTALTNNINAGFANQTSSINTQLSSVNNQISSVNTNVNGLSGQISTLNSNLSTTTDIAYVAIAVAIILGIAAIALSRRKPA
ncbi:MAG TPA: ABC transporter substrate-binding protein, partial [Nitrososphaerales archaeon]|nr:ABC transporter substrate-binding protein [Nitrososphaerales archaeon]